MLAALPFVSVLSGLPTAALGGLVLAAVLALLDPRVLLRTWRYSRPQFVIAVATVLVSLLAAPRVQWGVLTGVLLALALHLWRELRLDMDVWVEHDLLHVRPQGVLYFGSAPLLETRILRELADKPGLGRVELHLQRLGRIDLTGALALQAICRDLAGAGVSVVISGVQPQCRRLLDNVFAGEGIDYTHGPRATPSRRRIRDSGNARPAAPSWSPDAASRRLPSSPCLPQNHVRGSIPPRSTSCSTSATTWAVVGLSGDPSRTAYRIAALLQERGKKIVPIHPNAPTVLGEQGYATLADVPFEIDVVDVFRRSDAAGQFADEAVTASAKGVWFQLGVIDEAAFARTHAAGVPMVMDTCPAIEWRKRDSPRDPEPGRDLVLRSGPGLPDGLVVPGRPRSRSSSHGHRAPAGSR